MLTLGLALTSALGLPAAALGVPSHVLADTTSPSVGIGGVENLESYSTPVTPTFTASDPNLASVTGRLNGSSFSSGTKVSANGSYTLVVTAKDTAGNQAETSVRFHVAPPGLTTFVGTDRYETAVMISKKSYPYGSDFALLVKGDNFPDALCAAPLARAVGGPLLLTPTTHLRDSTKAELQRLSPSTVYVIGMPSGRENEVSAALPGVSIVRLRGNDRYHTAQLVARELKVLYGTRQQVVIAPGENFPDALSAGPLAASKGWPILLTPQFGTTTPAATAAALKELGATEALVVGTRNDPPGVTVARKMGTDRYETCGLILDYAASQGMSYAHLGFVKGSLFPDALSAGPYLSQDDGMIMLVAPGGLPASTKTRVQSHVADVRKADVIGLDTGLANQVRALLPGGGLPLAADQTFVWNINTEPPTLDPNLASDTTSVAVINSIFEGLVHVDPQGRPFPGIAKSWETSADGLTVTFNLRGTDKWSNGETVTSADFKNSWLRLLNPATAADYAYQLYFIDGAEAYSAGIGSAGDVGIDAANPAKLVVTLVAPTPWFVPMMAHQAFFPIHKSTVDWYGDLWTEPENIVTNGPFYLGAWTHDSDVLLVRNESWRGAPALTLDGVWGVMIPDPNEAVAAFEEGYVDVQMDLPVADMARLKQLPEYKLFPTLGVYYYGFNTTHPPLDDARVRKALSMAIDRQWIIDNITQANQVPASSFVPPGVPGFSVIRQDYIQPGAIEQEAKDLLADAGYPNGVGLPEIVIHYNTSEGHAAIAWAVQQQWKAIGVNATLKNMEWAQYLDYIQNNDEVMVYRMGWLGDFADAYNFLDVLRGGGGNNYTRWSSPSFDQGLSDALQAASDQDRWSIYANMEKSISVDEMPIAPIYWYSNPELVADWVDGYEPNPLGDIVNSWEVRILKY